jgi:6-phosphogluconolactonase
MLPEIVVDEAVNLGERLAALFDSDGRRAQQARGLFSVGLPGGSVAVRFFPRLARLPCDWSRTEFFWGDERAVPADDPESNYRLARSLWLDPAGIAPGRIHRMPADAPDLEQAAASHAAEMGRILGTPPRLDLVLLGVGPDGHVCSLFPGHPLLQEERRWVAPVLDAPKPPPRRLTLTLPALAAAERVVFVALGHAKSDVLREALAHPGSTLPVALVARRARQAVFLLDREAGSWARSASNSFQNEYKK